MSRLIIAFLFLLLGTTVKAQEFTATSLFSSEVFAPYIQIPFKVESPEGKPATRYGASVLNDSNNHCKVMQDPFIASNFILRCNASVTVNLHFQIHSDKIYNITYGPIEIKQLDDLVIVDERNPELENSISMGRALFSSNCISCHLPQSMQDRSAQQIQAMINTQPEMNLPVLKGLTPKQIEDIAVYLRNMGTSP